MKNKTIDFPQEKIVANIGQSILATTTKIVLLKGKGKTFSEAIADAFEKLKVISYNLSNNLLIQMATHDVVLKNHQLQKSHVITIGKPFHIIELEVTIIYKSIVLK